MPMFPFTLEQYALWLHWLAMWLAALFPFWQ